MIKFLSTVITGFLVLICMSLSVEASEGEYSVKPILEKNQAPSISSYFDVTVVPGGKQRFSLAITNHSNDTQQFIVEPNRAITNSNGVIDYSIHGTSVENEEDHHFEELITGSQTVDVPANEEKKVTFEFTVPAKQFDGIILGGFVVKPVSKKKSEEAIVNIYTHTIAAVIRETAKVIEPELLLKGVKIGQVNYRNAIRPVIQNPKSVLINEVKMTVTVTNKKSGKVVYEDVANHLNIAPNSTFSYPLLVNEPFSAGNYTALVELKTADNRWKYTKDFSIEEEETRQLNKKSVDSQPKAGETNQINKWLVVLIVLLLVTLIVKRKQPK